VPNGFFTCLDVVQAAIAELGPDAVVMMGEYGGRAMITVERIAQNLNGGRAEATAAVTVRPECPRLPSSRSR
jgi:pyrrolidone-carboxylate peptidase